MDSIWTEIEQLRQAPIAQVRARYREVFQEEPRSKHREHLFRRLAWRLQAISEGGLNESARQRAQEIANDADLRVLPPRDFHSTTAAAPVAGRVRSRFDRRIPRPGTILEREYRGDAITVRVVADGFEYQGRHYGSLSAIATEVTGTRWNGLAFFGLTRTHRTAKGARHV
jgi:Protein of unknown function (DUF2924)